MKVDVGVAEAIHPEDPAEVVAVEGLKPRHGEHAREKHDHEHEDRDGEERRPEMVGLGDQRQRDDRARKDGQKHVHSPK